MEFLITIDDPEHLAGITYARELYNASLTKDADGNASGQIATDAEYVSWVMTQAAASYARDKFESGIGDAIRTERDRIREGEV